MRVRIRNFRLKDKLVTVKGARVVASFTAQLDHFRIFELTLSESDRGFMVWAPRQVRLSMEGRARICEKAIEAYHRANEI